MPRPATRRAHQRSGPRLPQQHLIPGQVTKARLPAVRQEQVLPGIRVGAPAGTTAAALINPLGAPPAQAAGLTADQRAVNASCTTSQDRPHSRAGAADELKDEIKEIRA